MPKYTSDQILKSGVPLGGIGAGKIEILPQGTLDRFTGFSTHAPVSSGVASAAGLLGFHFGVWVKDRKKKITKLLQTSEVSDCLNVESISFDGDFPFARLEYHDPKLPVEIELEAFSSFIRDDAKNSAIPAAFFRFKVTNPFARSLEVSLCGMGRNMIGEWPVGRFNQVVDSPKNLALYFYNKKVQGADPYDGEMCLSVLKQNSCACTYLGEWNMQGAPFVFDKTTLVLRDAVGIFSQDGLLPNINTERLVSSESVQLGGALSAKLCLKPKSQAIVTFVLSWFAPNSAEGHMYETWFRNVSDVVQYSAEKYAELYQNSRAWVKEFKNLKAEPWLKDALMNNLYPLVSGSLWSKRGRFGLFESPLNCPLLGTIDVRFYGSLPLALLFPQLELKEISEFAEAQRPQGYIPHDLGFKRSDLPSNSTNGLQWKDTNPKFILLIWRDYLITKDEVFLKKMYPFAKKAFYWLCATDKNKDYLPDNEGADQTFDLWPFFGAGSYVSGIFLASLLALEKMAAVLQDADMQKEALLWFKKGQQSFEKKLWHKRYFIAYNSTKDGLSEHQLAQRVKLQKVNISCLSAQLTGQWIAHLLGLGYIVSEEKVRKAVGTLLEWNANASAFGAVNGMMPATANASAEKDKTNVQSENVWLGSTYILAALCLYEGFEKEGLELAKKAWENVSLNAKASWDQPDLCSSIDGSAIFGDHYMRNMGIWALLCATARKDKNIAKFIFESLPVGRQGAF